LPTNDRSRDPSHSPGGRPDQDIRLTKTSDFLEKSDVSPPVTPPNMFQHVSSASCRIEFYSSDHRILPTEHRPPPPCNSPVTPLCYPTSMSETKVVSFVLRFVQEAEESSRATPTSDIAPNI